MKRELLTHAGENIFLSLKQLLFISNIFWWSFSLMQPGWKEIEAQTELNVEIVMFIPCTLWGCWVWGSFHDQSMCYNGAMIIGHDLYACTIEVMVHILDFAFNATSLKCLYAEMLLLMPYVWSVRLHNCKIWNS